MDVQVNAGDWKGLNDEDKAKIQAIIQANFKDVELKSAENYPRAADALRSPQMAPFKLGKPLCMAACGIAEAAAVAACAGLSGPAVAVCIAAAHTAGELCRSKC